MRLSELLGMLNDFAIEAGDDDPEIRIAYQPSYPIAAELQAVTFIRREDPSPDQVKDVVWLAAAASVPYGENPYAPADAWNGEILSIGADEEAE